MPPNLQIEPQASTPVPSEQEVAVVQHHLREIVEGSAFRASRRSAQFLEYVVTQAIAGNHDSLKERMIGIDLFGRSPSYDTSDDAIVRVTATDVRKRLLQHYSGAPASSRIRITLPSGGYIPEIKLEKTAEPQPLPEEPIPMPPASSSSGTASLQPPIPVGESQSSAKSPLVRMRQAALHPMKLTGVIVVAASTLLLGALIGWAWGGHLQKSLTLAPLSTPLWTAFFPAQHTTFVVTSDPNIEEIQDITGSSISAANYALQKYLPANAPISADAARFCEEILRGNKAANVDVQIVARLAELAQRGANRIEVRAARDLRAADLDTDDNFIFLGNPRSDPWTSLFDDQLDFRFAFDPASQQEIVVNANPRAKEPSRFVPASLGFGSRASFATISFIANPNHSGQILLLSGTNAAGTKATGELATNLEALSATLQSCGTSPANAHRIQHFQILLGVHTMARSPRSFEVLACHLLNR